MEVAVLKLFERQHLLARWHDGFEAVVWLYKVDAAKAGRELVFDVVSVNSWGSRPPSLITTEQAATSSAAAVASVELVVE